MYHIWDESEQLEYDRQNVQLKTENVCSFYNCRKGIRCSRKSYTDCESKLYFHQIHPHKYAAVESIKRCALKEIFFLPLLYIIVEE